MKAPGVASGALLIALLLAIGAIGTTGATGCANILEIPDGRRVVSNDAGSGVICPGGTLEVRILVDATGPTSGVNVPYTAAIVDSINEMNEKNGINGCFVHAEIIDYAYDVQRAQELYDGWKASPEWPNVVAIFGSGSGDTLRLAPEVKQDKKPLISASYIGSIASPEARNVTAEVPELDATFQEKIFPTRLSTEGYPYNFFAGTDYSTGARIAMYHVSTQGAARVGFFHCDQAYCTGPIPAARTYARSLGLQIGRDLIVQLTDNQATYNTKVREYFEQERAHKVADPSYQIVDWVWGGNTNTTSAYLGIALAKAKADLAGGTPPLPDVQLIINNYGFDETLFQTCGAPCVDVVHGIMPFAAYGDTIRGSTEMPKVVALHDKWRAIEATNSGKPAASYKNVRYVQGYVSAMVFRVAVERAIAAGKAVSGESVKEALETFRNVDTGGLTDKLSFSPTDHRPQSTEAIYKMSASGKLVYEPPDRSIALDDRWLGW